MQIQKAESSVKRNGREIFLREYVRKGPKAVTLNESTSFHDNPRNKGRRKCLIAHRIALMGRDIPLRIVKRQATRFVARLAYLILHDPPRRMLQLRHCIGPWLTKCIVQVMVRADKIN